MFWLKACPRCHGDLHEVHEVGDSYISCLQCGRILSEQQEKALPRTAPRAAVRSVVPHRSKAAA